MHSFYEVSERRLNCFVHRLQQHSYCQKCDNEVWVAMRGRECVFDCVCLLAGLFETLPGRVQCEMLLKATEQCFNTLEKAEMLLLLLKRFPESVVQHGVRNKSITLA